MFDFLVKGAIDKGIGALKKYVGKADFNHDGIADIDQLTEALDKLGSILKRASSKVKVEDLMKAYKLAAEAASVVAQAVALCKSAMQIDEMKALFEEMKPVLLVIKDIVVGLLSSAKAVKVAEAPGDKSIDVA